MRTEHPIRFAVDDVLRSLPSLYLVGAQDDARFVIGPTGAFVLLPGTSPSVALSRDADRLHRLAEVTRNALCDHLTWVPFLDALVITAGALVRSTEATVAPLDLLAIVLTEGPEVIDRLTLIAVHDALADGRLTGWGPLPPLIIDGGTRIDLSDSARAAGAQR